MRRAVKSSLSIFKEAASFLASRYGLRIFATVLGALIASALLYPVLFVAITSVLRGNVIARGFEDIYKYGLSMEHYVTAITDQAFYSSLQVSALVSILTIITSLLVITPTAYGFSRFRFWGRDTMLFAYLVMSQVGGGFGVAAIIALFVFLARLHSMGILTLGNPFILPLIYTANQVPFQTWLLKSYFDALPKELDEASFIDGASWSQIVFKVVLPASKSAMIIIAMFAFMAAWGEFLIASFLKVNTLAKYIYETAVGPGQQINWSDFAAQAILFALPIITLYAVAQRYIGEAMRYGAVKG